jgi:enoyl-CoA hydratase/carnithine racemase
MSEPVLYEVLEEVAYITLNRPDKLNAMDDELLNGVAQTLAQASADPQAKVVVVRGAGRVFCAGGDVHDMPKQRSESDYRATRLPIEQNIALQVRLLGKPLIAQVHGAAMGGGCVLAALCDVRVATPECKFGLPEVRYGTVASLGGIFLLTRIIGLGRAFELLYLGDSFNGTRALEMGMVNRLVPPEDLANEVRAMALKMASHFGREMALTRKAIWDGLDSRFLAASQQETLGAMQAHLSGDVIQGFAQAQQILAAKKGNL